MAMLAPDPLSHQLATLGKLGDNLQRPTLGRDSSSPKVFGNVARTEYDGACPKGATIFEVFSREQ